jgi:hypothetical protein
MQKRKEVAIYSAIPDRAATAERRVEFVIPRMTVRHVLDDTVKQNLV